MTMQEYPVYRQIPEFHSVVTIQLCELIECGFFDPSDESWKWDAYDDAQYERLCSKFIDRYYFAEISLVPPGWWKREYKRKLNEIMPKYKILYKRVADGINPMQADLEYEKRRAISSEFPQTMLSGNSDYASSGIDSEYERVREGDLIDQMQRFQSVYNDVDVMVLDELECLFSHLYTVNVNSL